MNERSYEKKVDTNTEQVLGTSFIFPFLGGGEEGSGSGGGGRGKGPLEGINLYDTCISYL